jgi:hypothetical protein
MRLPLSLLSFAVPVLSLIGCIHHECIEGYDPAVDVTVTDANGARICDAQVTISQGTHVETVQPSTGAPGDSGPSSTCSYIGGSGSGMFTVTVARTGYVTQTVTLDTVPATDCGQSITAIATVPLAKE